jgi:F-type H+-transporting ATPase subunit b
MDIQLAQILFQIINFAVVFGALVYLLYKPVLKIFDERAKRIDEGQKAAQDAIETQANLDQLRKDSQLELKKQRASVVSKAQGEAKEQAQEILAKAKELAMLEVEKSRSNWEKEKNQLIKEMRSEMADAVVTIAESVIKKSLDAKTHKQLIDTQLDEVVKSL